MMKRVMLTVVTALSLALGVWTSSAAQTLTWLGTLGGDYSLASGVSADGSVVVGEALNASYVYRTFRWTAARGPEDLLGYKRLRPDGVARLCLATPLLSPVPQALCSPVI